MKQKNKKNFFFKFWGAVFVLMFFSFFNQQALAQTTCSANNTTTCQSLGGTVSSNGLICICPVQLVPTPTGSACGTEGCSCIPGVSSSCQSPLICNPATSQCVDSLGQNSNGSVCTLTNAPEACPCSDSGNNCEVGLTCISGSCQVPTNNASGSSVTGSSGTGSAGSSGSSGATVGGCPDGMTRDSSSGFCLPTTNPFPTTGVAASSSLSGLILSIIKFLLFFSGIIAVLFLIVGGFLYMSSGGNEEQAEKGKKTITNFALGLAVIIMAYAIVTILGNTLTDNKINVTSSGSSSITTGSGN